MKHFSIDYQSHNFFRMRYIYGMRVSDQYYMENYREIIPILLHLMVTPFIHMTSTFEMIWKLIVWESL